MRTDSFYDATIVYAPLTAFTPFIGSDMVGFDVSFIIPTTQDQCSSICALMFGCIGFSYAIDTRNCYPKYGFGNLSIGSNINTYLFTLPVPRQYDIEHGFNGLQTVLLTITALNGSDCGLICDVLPGEYHIIIYIFTFIIKDVLRLSLILQTLTSVTC